MYMYIYYVYISADPCRQQGERVREEITSNKCCAVQVRGKRAGDRKGSQVQSKKPKKGSEKGGAVSANVVSERSTKQELRSKNAGAAGGGPDPYSLKHSADPACSRVERARGGITSSKGQEVITSSKGKKQDNKKEEARSKKHLQATSGKKPETTSQEATSGWKTGQRASFLVDSESNVRQAAGRQLRELVFL